MSALTASLILVLLYIIYSCTIYFGKLLENTMLQWLWYAVIIISILLFVLKNGKDHDDNVSFGSLFGYGFKITAFLILFTIALTVILYSIFPEIKEQIFDLAQKQGQKASKSATAEEIQKQVDMFRRLFWVFIIGGIIFLYGILGCIGALLGAAVAKKNPKVFHEDSL